MLSNLYKDIWFFNMFYTIIVTVQLYKPQEIPEKSSQSTSKIKLMLVHVAFMNREATQLKNVGFWFFFKYRIFTNTVNYILLYIIEIFLLIPDTTLTVVCIYFICFDTKFAQCIHELFIQGRILVYFSRMFQHVREGLGGLIHRNCDF